MVMKLGKDPRGVKINANDTIYYFYRDEADDTSIELTYWTQPGGQTVGTSAWESQEEALQAAYHHYGWKPGTYRVRAYANFSGAMFSQITRPMPLPPGYARLGKSPHNGLPARAFAITLLERYPGATFEQVGDHILVFGQHYNGEISTAELARKTGYELPADVVRPRSPYAEISDDNQ